MAIGFGLVVGRVGGDDALRAHLLGCVGQQVDNAPRGRQPEGRVSGFSPCHCRMRCGMSLSRKSGDGARFLGRFRPQRMIDGAGEQREMRKSRFA